MEYSQDRARNKAVFPSLHLVQKVLGYLEAGRTSTRTLRAPHCRVGPLGGPGEFVVHLAYFPSSSVGDASFWSPPRGFSNLSKPFRTFVKPSTTFSKSLGFSRTTSNHLRRFFDFFQSCQFLIEVACFRASVGYIGAIGTFPNCFGAFRTVGFRFSASYCILNVQFRTSLIFTKSHSFWLFFRAF